MTLHTGNLAFENMKESAGSAARGELSRDIKREGRLTKDYYSRLIGDATEKSARGRIR
jgi:hypothetical protein